MLVGAEWIRYATSGMFNVGFIWFSYSLVHSIVWLGVISASLTAPYFLGPLIGSVATRHISSRALGTAGLLWATINMGLFVLSLAGHALSLTVVSICLMFLGAASTVFRQYYDASRQGMIAANLTQDLLVKTNSKIGVAQQLGSTAGPFLAGLAVSIKHLPYIFLANVVSLVIVALLVMIFFTDTQQPTAASEGRPNIWKDALTGFQYLRANRILSVGTLGEAAINLFFTSLLLVGLPAAIRSLQLAGSVYGIVLGCYSFGGAIGSYFAGKGTSRKFEHVYAITLMVTGVFLLGTVGNTADLIAIAMGLVGIGIGYGNVTFINFLHAVVEPDNISQVFSLESTISMGLTPVALVLGGWFIEQIGFRWFVFMTSLLFILVGVLLRLVSMMRTRPESIGRSSGNM